MRVAVIIALALCLPLAAAGGFEVEVLEETTRAVTVEFRLGSFDRGQAWLDGVRCSRIDLEGAIYAAAAGDPELPQVTRNLIVPHDGEVTLEIIELDRRRWRVDPIIPSAGRERRAAGRIFGPIYGVGGVYPEQHACLQAPYIMADVRGVAITFHPFLYDAARSELEIADRIRVRVITRKGEGGDRPPGARGRVARAWQEVYANRFLNPPRYPSVGEAGRLIVITAVDFQEAARSLVEWKRRQGTPTSLYVYPFHTGHTWESIRDFIADQYYSDAGVTFILLIGDAEHVPPAVGYSGWANGAEADPVYTLLAGDDEYPDAFIGRLSVETEYEAWTVVNKSLAYEIDPDPAGDWIHKAAGIASDEAFPPFPEDWILMEGLRERMEAYTYTEFTPIYDPGAVSAQVTAALHDGRGWVNYLGHGSPYGWSTSHFGIDDVEELANDFMTPVIISVACSNGDFAGQTCFAEAWQRLGTPELPRGAVLFMGSSVGQTTAAWIGQEEMIRLLVEEAYTTAGGIVGHGGMKAIDEMPGVGHNTGSECVQSWHLFGDPSLRLRTDVPIAMDVVHDTRLAVGSPGLEVRVRDGSGPVAGALVGVFASGVLYGSAFTDETGFGGVDLDPPPGEPGTLEVTVTARNRLPAFGSVTIVPVERVVDESARGLAWVTNPVRDVLGLTYTLSGAADVRLTVIDPAGRVVASMRPGHQGDGVHRLRWDTRCLPSGVYTYDLRRGRGRWIRGRFVVLR